MKLNIEGYIYLAEKAIASEDYEQARLWIYIAQLKIDQYKINDTNIHNSGIHRASGLYNGLLHPKRPNIEKGQMGYDKNEPTKSQPGKDERTGTNNSET